MRRTMAALAATGLLAVTAVAGASAQTIRVHDGSHANVRSAVVSGTWSGGASGTASCTTATNGTCSVKTSKLANSVASATFTVTGVTKAGSTYAVASNHEPDAGDTSTGTTITVNRPV